MIDVTVSGMSIMVLSIWPLPPPVRMRDVPFAGDIRTSKGFL
jgi:hypothetical protein